MNKKALIFDIKRFALYDGPGIRTTIFFKGCNLNCVWCQNPEGVAKKFELFYDNKKCIRCKSCVKACPINKLVINEKITLNEKRCLELCDKCFQACPTNAIYNSGKDYDVYELIKLLIKDISFYLSSSGGITLSGGEPLLQIGFLKEFLLKIKKYNLSVFIETCGAVALKNIMSINNLVDHFYFDIKIINPEKHKKYTGKSNKIILQNLKYMYNEGISLSIRIPLIPYITDTEENINDIILFLKKNNMDNIFCELLPYNRLAEVKYNKIGINTKNIDKYFKSGLKQQNEKKLVKIKKMFLKNNIKAKIISLE